MLFRIGILLHQSNANSAPSLVRSSHTTALCAGLYRIEEFRDLKYPVFTILTREPSPELRKIHDRMPVILPQEMVENWIKPDAEAGELVKEAITDVVFEKAI